MPIRQRTDIHIYLENYDTGWNPVSQHNVAAYKNIPAGRYVFRVNGCNSHGSWSEQQTMLEIIVMPSFWESGPAIILYVLFILAAIIIPGRIIFKMNRLYNEVEVEKQMTEYRLRFFTNVSHEFRTPLTIIRGSIETLNEQRSMPPGIKKQIGILDKSATRLMRLIDQLLEFRKAQNDKLKLMPGNTEAAGFFREIFSLFCETADKKRIDYTFTSNEQAKMIMLDRGKMDKVAFNLLSNAFKHTPSEGRISMEVVFDDSSESMMLTVDDSGGGIPEDKRGLLFQRFQQINYTDSGIGIGLHLVSELVANHNGSITYSDSTLGGASFRVVIPMKVGVDDLEGVDAVSDEVQQVTPRHADAEGDAGLNVAMKEYKILIIEDDEEIRIFLESQMGEHFTVFTAPDGDSGLSVATSEEPDLIICDVMMPGTDGFEVTRRLKNDFNTSHIPVVMLTAHSSIEHQMEGIKAGADAYIRKPFSPKYLILRVVKLIELRERLQHKFSREPDAVQVTICTTDKDREFIGRLQQIIEEHIGDSDFSVDDFTRAVNLGRTIFYRKVKGLTGYSPNEYVRVVRLKRAAEMLRTTDLNVSEIAYKVGFNDPFYFSRCFKEQFSVTPSQFKYSDVGAGV